MSEIQHTVLISKRKANTVGIEVTQKQHTFEVKKVLKKKPADKKLFVGDIIFSAEDVGSGKLLQKSDFDTDFVGYSKIRFTLVHKDDNEKSGPAPKKLQTAVETTTTESEPKQSGVSKQLFEQKEGEDEQGDDNDDKDEINIFTKFANRMKEFKLKKKLTDKEKKDADAKAKAKSRSDMTPETKEREKAEQKERMKTLRGETTPQTKEREKAEQKERMKTLRGETTPQTKEREKTEQKERMKTLRGETTPQTKEREKAEQKERMKTLREETTPQTKERQKAEQKERKKTLREETTPQTKERQKAEHAERMKTLPGETTPLTKEQQKAEQKERMKTLREKTTPQTKEQQKAEHAERKKTLRGETTPQTKEQQKAEHAERMKTLREKTTPQTKEQQKAEHKERMKTLRGETTPQTKEQQKAEHKERMKTLREETTPRTKESHKLTDRQRKSSTYRKASARSKSRMRSKSLLTYHEKQRKMTDEEKENQRQRWAKEKVKIRTARANEKQAALQDDDIRQWIDILDNVNTKFEKLIFDGCYYICVVANTVHFKHQVIQFHREKYNTSNAAVSQALDWQLPVSPDGQQYICKSCDSKLRPRGRKKPQLPVIAWNNKMSFDTLPDVLGDLNQMENRIICPRFLFMKVVQKGTGAKQPKIKGSVTNVPVDFLQDVCPSLPKRQIKETGICALKLKRKLCFKSVVLYHIVNIDKVYRALGYLIKHNPYFADIQIDKTFLKEWQKQDKELCDQLIVTDKDIQEPEIKDGEISSSDDDDKTDIPKVQNKSDSKVFDEITARSSNFVDSVMMADDGPVAEAEQHLLSDFIEKAKEEKNKEFLKAYDIAPGEGKTPMSLLRDPLFEVLAHPQLFPTGRYAYNIREERVGKLNPGEYVQARLFSADPRFSHSTEYIFNMQYYLEYKRVKESLSMSMRKSKAIGPDGLPLTAASLRNREQFEDLLKKDKAFQFLRPIRASPAYWIMVLKHVQAMANTFGRPTWFFSISCADTQWDDILTPIFYRLYNRKPTSEEINDLTWPQRCDLLRKDPVIVCRQWAFRIQQFFKLFVKESNIFGPCSDLFYRIEFQNRGAPHLHSLIWIRDAPKLDEHEHSDEEFCAFADKYVTTELPPEDGTPEELALRELVLTRQKHSCRDTCYKTKEAKRKQECRFRFPREPCETTTVVRSMSERKSDEELALMTEDERTNYEHERKLEMATAKVTLELRRTEDERFINPYNRYVLKYMKSNHDLQPVTNDAALLLYICGYVCKAEHELSTLMESAASSLSDRCSAREYLAAGGNAFLKGREVGAVEAVYRSCPTLNLRYQSRKCIYIPVGLPTDRTRLIKPPEMMAQMEDDEDDIFMANLLDRYALRPNNPEFRDMCLAKFASWFELASVGKERPWKTEGDLIQEREFTDPIFDEDVPGTATKILLEDDKTIMKRRTRQACISYTTYSVMKDPVRFYYSKLLLFLPWRTEDEMLGKVEENAEKFFNDNIEKMDQNIQDFEPSCLQDIQDTIQYFREHNEELKDALDERMPEGMQDFRDDEEEEDEEFDYANFDEGDDFITDIAEDLPQDKSKPKVTLTPILDDVSYTDMVAKLNTKQREILDLVDEWCRKTVEARNKGTVCPVPFYWFVSGSGGVGKSFLAEVIEQCVRRWFILKYNPKAGEARDPETIVVIKAAPTGVAAQNINGITLHSAFGLRVSKRGGPDAEGITGERQNYYKNLHANVELYIFDEISMVSPEVFMDIHEHAQKFKQGTTLFTIKATYFGGVPVLVLGDLYQIPPVRGTLIFEDPRKTNYLAKFIPFHPWRSLFKLHELVEVVRQKGHKRFIELLNNVRENQLTDEDEQLLMSRITKSSACPDDALRISYTNAWCLQYNMERLDQLKDKVVTIRAYDKFSNVGYERSLRHKNMHDTVLTNLIEEIEPDSGRDTGGLITSLKLAVGARVMLLRNLLVSDHMANGSMATVRHVCWPQGSRLPVFVMVEFDLFDDQSPGQVYRRNHFMVERKRQLNQAKIDINKFDPKWIPIGPEKTVFLVGHNKVEITRWQIPLTLCWACTIHKSQGITVNKLVVRMSDIRASGAAYVALSRVRSLEGLYLLDYKRSVIRCDKRVAAEYERLRKGIDKSDLNAIREKKQNLQKPLLEELKLEEFPVLSAATDIYFQYCFSKPDDYHYDNVNEDIDQLIRNAKDNPDLVKQIQVYYHNHVLKVEMKPSVKKQKKDLHAVIPSGFECLTIPHHGNSFYCAVSVLLFGNSKTERSIRSLACAFFILAQGNPTERLNTPSAVRLHDTAEFSKMYVRGKDATITAIYCLCCSIGCEMDVAVAGAEETSLLIKIVPTKTKLPFIGTLLWDQAQNRFWILLKKKNTKSESFKELQFVVGDKLDLTSILGHEWNVKATDFIPWDQLTGEIGQAQQYKRLLQRKLHEDSDATTQLPKQQHTSKNTTKPDATDTTKTTSKPIPKMHQGRKTVKKPVLTTGLLPRLTRLRSISGLGLTDGEFKELSTAYETALQQETQKIIAHLTPTDYLNDDSIYEYFHYLSARGESSQTRPGVHSMNIVFYRRCDTILNGSPTSAELATAENHVQSAMFGIHDNRNSLLESDLVLVPIFSGIEATPDNLHPPPGHWSLAVIDNRDNTIKYYDSLSGVTRAENVLYVLQHFVAEAKKRDVVRYNQTKCRQEHVNMPQQMNGYDCGVFMLAFASYICSDMAITTSQEEMPHWRQLTGYVCFCRPYEYGRVDFL